VDRHLAALQAFDLLRVDIDAEHTIARVGKAGASDKTYVTRSKNSDFQRRTLSQKHI
jgi:hypothetical protein